MTPANSDAYTAAKASKHEYFLSSGINIKTADVAQFAGAGYRGSNPITTGDVAAAIAFHKPKLYLAGQYLSEDTTKYIVDRLLYAKYTSDPVAGRHLYHAVLSNLLLNIIHDEPMTPQQRNKHIADFRGVMRNCARTLVEDICCPYLFKGLSSRVWAYKLEIKCHKTWQTRWSIRYQKAREVLQEIDEAIIWAVIKHL